LEITKSSIKGINTEPRRTSDRAFQQDRNRWSKTGGHCHASAK